ncbi:MAG: chromophore lyase CpcT/CpeT [Scytonema sp. PMC 1069.18]|nr:chromophore lyase CpcT/CpeT [Scytonema sp. PMC 1069.18]MEC4882583.1 chromophore lyase CpcT/CpeT [Scytonema sp. PMC 1070.18]
MKKLKVYTLTVIISALTFPQASRAANIAPPIETQVEEVAQWFTGLFNNVPQVASNPSVPLISMSNCKVKLQGVNSGEDTENIYLEQKSSAFERQRFYSFSSQNSELSLSVRSFLNAEGVSGLCDRPESERVVNISNIATASCDLLLMWEPNRYVGTNTPSGCSTSTGGKVVSDLSVFENRIESLDRIFDASGNILVATPIEFRRINPIPEPSLTLGLLAIGVWGVSSAHKCKQKKISFSTARDIS